MLKKYFIIIFFLIFSCDNSKETKKGTLSYSNSNFTQKKLVSKRLDSISNNLMVPARIYLINKYLIVLDIKSKNAMHIIDIDNKEYIGSYGKKGQGPGEIIEAWSISKKDDNSFLLMDIAQRKILGYNINSLLNKDTHLFEQKINQNSLTSFVELYKNNLFYIDEYSFNNRLFSVKFDEGSSNVVGYGKVPVLTSESEADNVKAAAASVIMKSKNGFFVFAYRMSPRIDIFNYNDNTWKTIISPEDFKIKYKPQFDEGEHFFAVTKETLNAYIDFTLTDKYIYVLFSEDELLKNVTSQGKYIYVFDYQGNPVKQYILDKEISYFDVKNDSVIYGLSVEVFPELVTFDLNN